MKKYRKILLIGAFLLVAAIPAVREVGLCLMLSLLGGRAAAGLVAKLHRHGCPRWLAGALIMGVAAGVLLMGAYWGLSRLCDGVECVTEEFPDLTVFFRRMEEAAEALPGSIGGVIREVFALLEQKSEKLPQWFAAQGAKVSKAAFSALPGKLLFLFVGFVAAYYAAVDWPQISAALRKLIPEEWEKQAQTLLRSLQKGGMAWLRIQGKLALLQFLLLAVGFFLLRLERPIPFAMLTAAADALPLLGTGAILAPWAAILWLLGEGGAALGMLILWGCSWLLRGILEPRLVGHQAGISPFYTILGMYLGLRCFGMAGMIGGVVLISALGAGMGEKQSREENTLNGGR